MFLISFWIEKGELGCVRKIGRVMSLGVPCQESKKIKTHINEGIEYSSMCIYYCSYKLVINIRFVEFYILVEILHENN